MLLNIPVNNNGHVGKIASDFVRLLPNNEMNDTSSNTAPFKFTAKAYMQGQSKITTFPGS